MNVPLYIENPKDGTATYDVIDVFYSNDSYASALVSPAIDLTTRSQFSPGFTKTVHTSGNNYSYKARYRSTVTSQVSGFSPIVAEGESFAILEARRLLDDDAGASELFSEDDMLAHERSAVEKLFPRVMADAKDASLTIAENVIDYGLPVGVFRITKIEKGTKAADNLSEIDNFEILEGKTLRLTDGDIGEVLPITIYFKRAFRNAGEVPMVLQKFLVYEILAECYDSLANQRGVKFKAFQALQRETDVRPETFVQLAEASRAKAEKEILSRVERG